MMLEWLRIQLKRFKTNCWARWTPVERTTFSAVVGVVGILLLVLLVRPITMTGGAGYVNLITDLEVVDRQDIVIYLNRNGIPYRLEDNGRTVKVPKSDVYRAKFDIGSGIVLAGGQRGFNLFKEPRIGITDQYFKKQQINAREIEIERTIRAGISMIETVFVHLNLLEESLFKEDQNLPSATVKVIARGTLDPENVESIRTLVAYGTKVRDPDRVQVVDGNMRILSRGYKRDPLTEVAGAQLAITRQFEHELEQKAWEVLQPVRRKSVQVTAELDFNHVDTTQTSYDPDSVVRFEETETESSTQSAAGDLPGKPVNVSGVAVEAGQGTIRESEKAKTEYDIGKTVTIRQEREFEIQRLSVAVVVDATDNTFEQELGNLVKKAVGYNSERDEFAFVTLPFDKSEEQSMILEAKERKRWDVILAGVYIGIVILVFIVMLVTVTMVFKRRARTYEHMMSSELDMMQQAEAMKRKRECSVEELGLAEVGDGYQLSEEEQTRVKIKQKIDGFAQEQPAQFAQIIKTWLHE